MQVFFKRSYSFNVSNNSCPSRIRSPIPAKNASPLPFLATLWISSIVSTVFPTPAPPRTPTFLPLTKGVKKSITLIPVSRISGFWIVKPEDCLEFKKIFFFFIFAGSGVCPSTTSPKGLNILPIVSGPTGISIPRFVLITGIFF